jgi:hypothetical protein
VITLFAEARGPAQARQVAQQISWLATQQVDRQAGACRASCAWCCSLFVSVTAPEIIQIADYLRATSPVDALAALHERLAEHSMAQLPCVLPVIHQCSLYPARVTLKAE